MARRVTVPEGHVAVILPAQLADEASAFMRAVRSETRMAHARVLGHQADHVEPSEGDATKSARFAIAGDLLLALTEAKEA